MFFKKTISILTSISILILLLNFGIINTVNAATSTVPLKITVSYPVNYTAGSSTYSAGELVNKPLNGSGVKFKMVLSGPGISGGSCTEEKVLPVINGLMSYNLGSNYLATGLGCNIAGLSFNSSYTVNVSGDLTEPSNGLYNNPEDFITSTTYETFVDDEGMNSFLDSKTLDIQNKLYSKTLTLSGGLSGSSTSGNSSSLTSKYELNSGVLMNQLISQGKEIFSFDINNDDYDDIFARDMTTNKIAVSISNNGQFESAGNIQIVSTDVINKDILKIKDKTGNFLFKNSTLTKYYVANGYINAKLAGVINSFIPGKSITIDNKIYFYNSNNYYTELYNTDAGLEVNYTDIAAFSASNLNGSGPLDFLSYSSDQKKLVVMVDEINSEFTGIDGSYYVDINNDNKLDLVTYVNSGSNKLIKIYLMNGSNTFTQILGGTAGLEATNLKINGALTGNNIGGNEVKDIMTFVEPTRTRSIYKVNSDQLGTTNIGNIIGDQVRVLGGEAVQNKDGLLQDNKIDKKNDRFLLVSSNLGLVASKNLKYNKYELKSWNGSAIVNVQITKNSVISDFAGIGDNFIPYKAGVSDFYLFGLDSKDGKSVNDFTSVYVIWGGIIREVIIDAKKDGGFTSLYKGFGLYDINITNAKGGILQFYTPVSFLRSAPSYNFSGQNNFDVKSDGFLEDNQANLDAALKTDLSNVLTGITVGLGSIFDIDRHYSTTERATLYSAISGQTYGVGSPASHDGKNSNANFGYTVSLFSAGKLVISSVINSTTFNNTNGSKIILSGKSFIGIISNSLSNQPILDLGGDRNQHFLNKLKSFEGGLTKLNSGYMWNDNTFGNTIYFDNGGIGVTKTSNIKITTASTNRRIPYLDSAGTLLGRSGIVFGDSTRINSPGYAPNLSAPGIINKMGNVNLYLINDARIIYSYQPQVVIGPHSNNFRDVTFSGGSAGINQGIYQYGTNSFGELIVLNTVGRSTINRPIVLSNISYSFYPLF